MKRHSAYSINYRRSTACLLAIIGLLGSYRVYFEQRVKMNPPEIVWFEAVISDTISTESREEVAPQIIRVNSISSEELQAFGLSPVVADRWVKFRYRLKNFSTPEELKSIYGLPEEWMDDFIWDFTHSSVEKISKYKVSRPKREVEGNSRLDTLPVRITNDTNTYLQPKQREQNTIAIDINNSNQYQWQLLPGIGPYYAKRITGFRDKLGGFTSKEQVADTYGLPDSVFLKILPYLQESPIFKQLDINVLSVSELATHPYIRYKEASILVNFRKNQGSYSSIQDLYAVRAFDSIFIQRLQPYLTFKQVTGKVLTNDEPDEK